VVARVKTVLRRTQPDMPNAATEAPLQIDETRYSATLDGQELELTPVEFRLLKAMVAARGAILSREKLLDHLYEDHRVVNDRTVDTHVKNLRRKLEKVRPEGEVIRSIYGVGYRLTL
jgi:two-component system response regulator BaeR